MIFGSGQPLITGGQLKALKIKVPTDQTEQQRIATCLSSLDELITAETQKLEALKTHKRGLMQQLFPSPEDAS
jgi:type I restriction enzyme S subunit